LSCCIQANDGTQNSVNIFHHLDAFVLVWPHSLGCTQRDLEGWQCVLTSTIFEIARACTVGILRIGMLAAFAMPFKIVAALVV
jgi:hypothetical protein